MNGSNIHIRPFIFEGHKAIRVVDLQDDKLWMVGKDVAEALGYVNPRDALKKHCKHGRPVGEGVSGSVMQGARNATPLDPQTIIIPEGDVYRLVLRSKLPTADRLEAWIADEVLPTLRRTGTYTMPGAPQQGTVDPVPMQIAQDPAWAAWLALPAEERRARQRDMLIAKQAGGTAMMRWAMWNSGYPIPPHYLLGVREQFEMELQRRSQGQSILIAVNQTGSGH